MSYDEVAEAARSLLARGENPSIQAVRNTLNTGSTTTIHNHMKQFWLELGGSLAEPRIPELPAEISKLMRRLWNEAIQGAGQQFDAERQAHNEALDEAGENLRATRERLEDSEEAIRQQRLDLAERDERISALNESLATAGHTIDERDRELVRQRSEAENAQARHEGAVAALESDVATLRGLLDNESKRHLADKAQYYEDRRLLSEQTEARENHWLKELDSLRQETADRLEEMREAKTRSEEHASNLQASLNENESARQRLNEKLLTLHAEHGQQVQSLTNGIVTLQEEARTADQAWQVRLDGLREERDQAHSALSDATARSDELKSENKSLVARVEQLQADTKD